MSTTSSKGISPLITYLVVIGMVIASVSLVLTQGLPLLEKLQDTAAIESSIDTLVQLDTAIRRVAAGGQYTTQEFTIRNQRGEFHFDEEQNAIYYEIESNSDIISTHASRQIGPVTLSANTDVNVFNTTVDGTPCYMMENQYLRACIREADNDHINNSELLVHYHNRDLNTTVTPEMEVLLNGLNSTIPGNITTEPEQLGDNLGRGRVTATVESDYGFIYDIQFDLLPGSDFLKIEVR